jgi:site-specific DNA-methyltransferase (cytosine-N4-specific)
MLWLGFDQPRFKREEIGSHRKYSAKHNGATAVTFLSEMTEVLRGVAATLKPSALCVLVVGDSIVRGEVVRNDGIIQAAGEAAGLRHLVTLQRNIHSGRKAFNPGIGKIRHEHLIFFRRP